MNVETKSRLLTVEEYDQLSSDIRCDLINGRLVPMVSWPGEYHGRVTANFSMHVSIYIEDRDWGDCFAAGTCFIIRRDPDSVIAPDWGFIRKERRPEGKVWGSSPVVPDALLEVRSPPESSEAVAVKMKMWINAGVRLAWELEPEKRILTVYRPGAKPREIDGEGIIDGEDVIPGLTLPMRRLFPK